MPQKHDIGVRKRAHAEQAARTQHINPDPASYARSLVRRGLAGPGILDHIRGHNPKDDRRDD